MNSAANVVKGGEGGGHTGRTPYSVLIPACVDICKGKKSPLNGEPVRHYPSYLFHFSVRVSGRTMG